MNGKLITIEICLYLQKTRSEADEFCRDHQMQLVWFESKEENNEVAKLMIENGTTYFKQRL